MSSSIPATASSSDAAPRARLYPHVLGSIYSFLRLSELVPVTGVSKLWLESVLSTPCIGAGLPRAVKLATVCTSALATHLASSDDQGALSIEQVCRIARGCPNLQSLRCELPLPAAPSVRTLVLPPKLSHVSLRIPFGTAVVKVNALFTILSFMPHLTRIQLTLPTCDPALSFAAFRRAALRELQIEWTWAGAPLTDAHIAQLGSIQHLRTLLLPAPNLSLMQRLFKPNHPFKLLQRFSHLAQVDHVRAALLLAVPSLTRLSMETCTADLAFFAQMPQLTSLRVWPSPGVSCTALIDCVHLTDLTIRLYPGNEEDLCALLTRHTALRSLTVNMLPMAHLRFLHCSPNNTTLTSLTLEQVQAQLVRSEYSQLLSLRGLTELRLHCAQAYFPSGPSESSGIPAPVLDQFRIPCDSLPALRRFEVTQPWQGDAQPNRNKQEEL